MKEGPSSSPGLEPGAEAAVPDEEPRAEEELWAEEEAAALARVRSGRRYTASAVALLVVLATFWIASREFGPTAIKAPGLALMIAPLLGAGAVKLWRPAARRQSVAQVAAATWGVLIAFRIFFGLPAIWFASFAPGDPERVAAAIALALLLGAATWGAAYAAAAWPPNPLVTLAVIALLGYVAVGSG